MKRAPAWVGASHQGGLPWPERAKELEMSTVPSCGSPLSGRLSGAGPWRVEVGRGDQTAESPDEFTSRISFSEMAPFYSG